MQKSPKCAYRVGDLVTQEGQMGVVINADGDFYTYQTFGSSGFSHTTMNVTIKHYLKLVKAQHEVLSGRGSTKEFVARNITLEEELLGSNQKSLIDGSLDRLTEDTKNKRGEQ